MAKAFWFFSKNTNDGIGNNAPSLPAGLSADFRMVVPGDIYRLGTAFGHLHLLIGGFAIQDDNLIGDDHTHLVVNIRKTYLQLTRSAVEHDHPLSLDVGGNLMQDWFLCFCYCSNANAVLIANHVNCFPIVEAEIIDGEIGDLDNTPWDAGELSTWEVRLLNVLGFALPDDVDRGERLVQLFIGSLISRPVDERYVRFVG